MTFADFEKFREIVLHDSALQNRLRETTDRAAFAQLIVELGTKHGFQFTVEDVAEAMRQARRVWLEKWK